MSIVKPALYLRTTEGRAGAKVSLFKFTDVSIGTLTLNDFFISSIAFENGDMCSKNQSNIVCCYCH